MLIQFAPILTILIQVEPQDSTPIWLPILIIIILLLLLWWGLTRNSIPEATSHEGHQETHDHGGEMVASHPHHEEAHVEPSVPSGGAAVAAPPQPPKIEPKPIVETSTSTTPDDLKVIEGIGPKIESVLHAAGITTFSQVAQTSAADLTRIVKEEGGVRLAFPDSWPEQAELAANQEWGKLESLQDTLKGGRRV